MLTYHQWDPVTNTWGQFHLRHHLLELGYKLSYLKNYSNLQVANELVAQKLLKRRSSYPCFMLCVCMGLKFSIGPLFSYPIYYTWPRFPSLCLEINPPSIVWCDAYNSRATLTFSMSPFPPWFSLLNSKLKKMRHVIIYVSPIKTMTQISLYTHGMMN